MMLSQRTRPIESPVSLSSNRRCTATKIACSQRHSDSLTIFELRRYSCGECVQPYRSNTCSMAPERRCPQQYMVTLFCSAQYRPCH